MRKATGDELGLNEAAPATCFPPAVAVGNSWSTDAARQVGAAIAVEARALGVDIVLGPGVNIKRTPLCGRNFEYYSEDPLLAGTLGAAHVEAQQGGGVGASVKHFAANNQETERMRVDAQIDERTLREIYLPAFERVVRENRAATVMASYNKINGTHATENPWLLTEVLREQWGFDGLVMSDWGAVEDPVASVAAGLDLQMPGPASASASAIVDAVRSGDLAEADLDRAVASVLALRRWSAGRGGDFDVDAHHAIAREVAASCAVLLKNDGDVLPLRPETSVAVIGEFARTPRFQGGGSSRVNPTRVEGAWETIRSRVGDGAVFAAGFTLDGSGDAESLRSEAVAAARNAVVAVVFAGLADDDESEGFDRDRLSLPEDQVELIRAVAAAAPRTVVVLSHGGVVTLEGWHDDVDAVLDGFLLGQAGGAALVDLIYGASNPSGRLSETIPTSLESTSAYLNFPGDHREVRYGEGVFVGYRAYQTVGTLVRYPFGHGLSYTTFGTTDLAAEATGPVSARVTATVTNTGTREGRQVVQLYVGAPAGPVHRPRRELRAFTSVTLAPGQSEQVSFELDSRAFAYWDVDDAQWVVPAGRYRIEIGDNARDIVAAAEVELDGNEPVRALTRKSSIDEWLDHPVIGGDLLAEELAKLLPEKEAAMMRANPAVLRLMGSMPADKALTMFGADDAVPALDELAARTR
nr:glycoside hydrolase family 3 C-terminal domain-containing protein [Flexivirga aerilata]